MTGIGLIFGCILTPLIGAFFLPLLGNFSKGLRNIAALLMVLTSLVCAGAMLPAAVAGAPYAWQMELPLGFSFGFLADALAVFMAMTSSLVASIIVLYSYNYIEHYDNQNEYYLMAVLFIGAMMGLVLSTNLIVIYLFWEISAICCWRLIGFYRQPETIRRANKAFLITVGGALLMLVGFIAIYQQTGTFNLVDMQGVQITNAVMALILCGILSKSATLPLHSWLPDAGVAPSPATSLLHAAVLVKIGVYVFARLFLVNFTVDPIWNTVLPAICAVSALVSAGAALVENDIKRIIAYSTISQLAYILLGLSCGNKIGVYGALLYIMMHSIAKGGLFLCAGIIEHSIGTKDIRQMGGLARRLPLTAVAFACCALSVMGFPPFGGFFAKHLVIEGAYHTGQLWMAPVFVIGAVMTVMYLMRLFYKVFFGRVSHPDVHEHGWEMILSVSLMALLSLFSGIFINLPSGLVNVIIESMGRW